MLEPTVAVVILLPLSKNSCINFICGCCSVSISSSGKLSTSTVSTCSSDSSSNRNCSSANFVSMIYNLSMCQGSYFMFTMIKEKHDFNNYAISYNNNIIAFD